MSNLILPNHVTTEQPAPVDAGSLCNLILTREHMQHNLATIESQKAIALYCRNEPVAWDLLHAITTLKNELQEINDTIDQLTRNM